MPGFFRYFNLVVLEFRLHFNSNKLRLTDFNALKQNKKNKKNKDKRILI